MSRQRSFVGRKYLFVEFSETELNKLKIQYQKAQGATQAYNDTTQGLNCRQKREIKKLQDEQEELLCSLRYTQSGCNRFTDASVVQDLTAMLARGDSINGELEAEKDKVASLNDQILKWERTLAEQKTGGGTTHHSMNLIKNIYLKESKLYRGRKCLNTKMVRNGELRDELSILQIEKKQFLQVQTRLERELHTIRKDISNPMTQCTEAFHAGAKIQERQKMLMEQNAKDVAYYLQEMSKLEQEMYSFNFEEFLGIKAIVHNSQDSNHRKVKHKELELKELPSSDYEDAMKKILTETKEIDPDQLLRNFIQMEEQNYTLLKFVNYQHNEAESIRRQISKLCNERKIFVAEEQRQQEQHHALEMKVSVKQETTEQHLAGYQKRVEFIEKLLDQLGEGFKSLLRISYDSSVTCDQLGSSDIVEYLGRVENRVNELLTLQAFIHFQEDLNPQDIDSLSTFAGQILGMTPPAVNQTTAAGISATDFGDNPDVESLLLEPGNREDLLTLVKARIERRKKTDGRP